MNVFLIFKTTQDHPIYSLFFFVFGYMSRRKRTKKNERINRVFSNKYKLQILNFCCEMTVIYCAFFLNYDFYRYEFNELYIIKN